MVRIRLSRGGAKKKPFYHIVVMDQRQRRDGRCLERIGTYDPSLSTNDRIKLNHERLDYWKSKGAQLSERVKLLREYSLDENSSETRLAIKEKNLEKIKQNRLAKKKEAEAPAEEAAAPEAPAEEAAAPEAPAEEAAAEAPAEEAPAEEAAAPEAPAEEAAAPEAPAEEAAAPEAPAEEAAAPEAPAEEAAAPEAPAEEAAAPEAPAEESKNSK